MIKGGEFLIKDQKSKDIFIPEEFTEEQKLMASSTNDFVEKELHPYREKFEDKNYNLTEACMKKAGELILEKHNHNKNALHSFLNLLVLPHEQ